MAFSCFEVRVVSDSPICAKNANLSTGRKGGALKLQLMRLTSAMEWETRCRETGTFSELFADFRGGD